MSITYWTLGCGVCGQQMVAERPDAEYTCNRCGTVQPGVTARRSRTLEQVTTGTNEFLRRQGAYPEYGSPIHAAGSALASMLRWAYTRWSGSSPPDDDQRAEGAARLVAAPTAVVPIP